MALPGDSWLVPVPNPFPEAASPAGNPNPIPHARQEGRTGTGRWGTPSFPALQSSRGSGFSSSALAESMPRGSRSCSDSFGSPRLCRRVWVRFCLPREPHGLSFLAAYGSDQIRFLSSSQAGNFGFGKKKK